MDQKTTQKILFALPKTLYPTGATFIERCEDLLNIKEATTPLKSAQSLIARDVLPPLERYANSQKAGDEPGVKRALAELHRGCIHLTRQGHKSGAAIGQMGIHLTSQLQSNLPDHNKNGHSLTH